MVTQHLAKSQDQEHHPCIVQIYYIKKQKIFIKLLYAVIADKKAKICRKQWS